MPIRKSPLKLPGRRAFVTGVPDHTPAETSSGGGENQEEEKSMSTAERKAKRIAKKVHKSLTNIEQRLDRLERECEDAGLTGQGARNADLGFEPVDLTKSANQRRERSESGPDDGGGLGFTPQPLI